MFNLVEENFDYFRFINNSDHAHLHGRKSSDLKNVRIIILVPSKKGDDIDDEEIG